MVGGADTSVSELKPPESADATAGLAELSGRAWRIGVVAVLLLACTLRLGWLGLKPLHHDEGVNGIFLSQLLHKGIYRYDPSNYHGPTLCYLSLVVCRLAGLFTGGDGLTDATIRTLPALAGIATVMLILLLRRRLGRRSALAAAALVAVSPGAVFYSRYFIHETLFVFFTFAIAISAMLWHEEARARWMLAGAAAAALLFATKETAIVSILVLEVAAVVHRGFLSARGMEPAESALWLRRGRLPGALLTACGAVLLFVAIDVTFFSSFFRNFPRGVYDAIQSVPIWTQTGVAEAFHPRYAYLGWFARQEWVSLVAGIVGTLALAWRWPRGFGMFAGIWAAGMFSAYTLIPYKTPWLLLNFSIPLAIAGGAGVTRIWENAPHTWRPWLLAVGIGGCGVLLYQTIRLNFVQYDDNSQPYVYVHTNRSVLELQRDVDALAARIGAGQDLDIAILAPEYWPLPWYLREYRRVGYWGRAVQTDVPVVIAAASQQPELQARLGPAYQLVRFYNIRPNVTLILLVREPPGAAR